MTHIAENESNQIMKLLTFNKYKVLSANAQDVQMSMKGEFFSTQVHMPANIFGKI
jgi:hypothetical protein